MYRRKMYARQNRMIVLEKNTLVFVMLFIAMLFLSFFITRTNLLAPNIYLDAFSLSVPGFGIGFKDEARSPFNCYNILSNSVPAIQGNEQMQKKYAAMFFGKNKESIKKDDEEIEKLLKNGEVREVNSSGGMSVNNLTDYSININEILNNNFLMDVPKDIPKILIISTHSSEAYSDSAGGRNDDENKNVLKVGEVLAQTLNKGKIKTIHDKTRNDYPSYNGSYKKALSVIESNLLKYPQIEIVIDVHRDYMETADSVRLKPTAQIEGEGSAAQIMFVIGTDSMGLEHPNWRENLALAAKLQSILNVDAPELCRSINIRTERFNQHAARGSMIVEIGSSENTLNEACLSARLLGEAIIKAFKN